MVADLAGPAYKLELSSPLPSIGMVNVLALLVIYVSLIMTNGGFLKIFEWIARNLRAFICVK